jgi:hypothetical protein
MDQTLLCWKGTRTNESGTYTYLKFIESQQDKFETMRLLYVAAFHSCE